MNRAKQGQKTGSCKMGDVLDGGRRTNASGAANAADYIGLELGNIGDLRNVTLDKRDTGHAHARRVS